MTPVFLFTAFWALMNINFETPDNSDEAKGLEVGSVAPVFTAIDARNNRFSLEESFQQGPVVLIFYRGQWCPVCNRHLGQLQDSLHLITGKGARVVAVSPEKPEFLEKMEEKSRARFTLLYDEGYKISDAYDVAFKPAATQLFMINTVMRARLKEAHDDDAQLLPIPATYIIGTDGVIVWRQFDPDYKKRSSIKDILDNLPD